MEPLFPVPPVGARFEFRYSRLERRVYELVESLPEGKVHSCDRHTLRLVEEEGFQPERAGGIGFEFQTEDAWFTTRTDARRVA
jgi:hypothetical protein